MTDQSLGRLTETLTSAAQKVRRFKDRRIGEQNTKTSLIEPVLEALGWDVRDPDEVHQEFRPTSRDNPVDYALKLMRQPRLFVEAKGLGENLSDRKWIAQVLGYATVAGVEWCLLTDGDEFRFYNATAPVDADEKLFCRVVLSSDQPHEAAQILCLVSRINLEENNLDRLWKSHFIDRRVKAAVKAMLDTVDAGLVRLLRRRVSNLRAKDIIESVRRLDVQITSPSPVLVNDGPSHDGAATKETHSKGQKKLDKRPDGRSTRKAINVSLSQIIGDGLLKPPVRLFRKYKGKEIEARLMNDGSVEFQKTRYDSCSTAAEVARSTVTGRRMNTNGWGFWCYQDANGKRTPLNTARVAYLAKHGT